MLSIASPATMSDHPPGRLYPDLQHPSTPMDRMRNDTTWPAPVTGTRIQRYPQRFQDQASATIDASRKTPGNDQSGHDQHSSASSLKTQILREMRMVARTLDSERLLIPSANHLVPRLDMWLNQHSYLNGRQVWISQPAAPLRLGSLMQTLQAPDHDPSIQFLPEYGELVKLNNFVVDVESITPKSGPFRGVFWMSQNGIFCPKTHFPENQKSQPKAL